VWSPFVAQAEFVRRLRVECIADADRELWNNGDDNNNGDGDAATAVVVNDDDDRVSVFTANGATEVAKAKMHDFTNLAADTAYYLRTVVVATDGVAVAGVVVGPFFTLEPLAPPPPVLLLSATPAGTTLHFERYASECNAFELQAKREGETWTGSFEGFAPRDADADDGDDVKNAHVDDDGGDANDGNDSELDDILGDILGDGDKKGDNGKGGKISKNDGGGGDGGGGDRIQQLGARPRRTLEQKADAAAAAAAPEMEECVFAAGALTRLSPYIFRLKATRYVQFFLTRFYQSFLARFYQSFLAFLSIIPRSFLSVIQSFPFNHSLLVSFNY
jgi:hypothetical protein